MADKERLPKKTVVRMRQLVAIVELDMQRQRLALGTQLEIRFDKKPQIRGSKFKDSLKV